MTMTKVGLGDYLVDANGMTLYYFTKDTVGKSNASDAVIANWPIFYTANIIVPSNLNTSDFGTITRDDGKMQTTYKGWPLYYYIKDQAVGDTVGHKVNGVWFVIDPQNFPPTGGSY
jgi:predicted lipoprotein with Yx(FWY)xxD motif